MNNFNLNNFEYSVICDNGLSDAKVSFEADGDTLAVFISADESKPRFVNIKWNCSSHDDIYILGDAWERSYGDLEFLPIGKDSRNMPWYFIATDGRESFCLGVKTQPNAFVCFRYDKDCISAKIDCRNGSDGVSLCSQKLMLCRFIVKRYPLPPFESLTDFCSQMCERPVLPAEKVYGGNNWYFAYGKSSYDEIVENARLQAELSRDIETRPFMVIDDGWQVNSCCGPWVPNERFRDMKSLADDIKALGVRPGIWVRFLNNSSPLITDEMRIFRDGEREYLDPTVSEVKSLIKEDIKRIKDWGYELLKHDFTTVDLFGSYGKDLDDTVTKCENWHFADTSKTNAQIVLDLYRLIKDECGEMLIIGCNTVSHLCAGLVQINRTGDDTSGREWERTKRMGVNTLAFRLPQNNTFYTVDADCVGIMDKNIPWSKNSQWLDILSKSDTAFFTSCACLEDAEKEDVKKAYREFQNSHSIKPLDIYNEKLPSEWVINGETIKYNWD